MSAKKTETIIYKGLGFPVKLIDVPMKKMFGDWVMDIDMTELQIVVLRALIYQPRRLTKQELKFIRHFLEMTTAEFGKAFGVRHSAVVQWENGKRNITPSTEIYIRLYVLNRLRAKDKEFRELYDKVKIEQLIQETDDKPLPLELEISDDLKIAL